MGSSFSRPKQQRQPPRRKYRRRTRRDSMNDFHRHRGHQDPFKSTSTSSFKRQALSDKTLRCTASSPQTTAPRDEYQWPRSGDEYIPQQPTYKRRSSHIQDRRHEALHWRSGDSNSNESASAWAGPLPLAPMPPGWDDRFYAGIALKHAEHVRRPETISRKPSYHGEGRKRGLHANDKFCRKVFIDIDDPFWRGVRVNLVEENLAPPREPRSRRPEN